MSGHLRNCRGLTREGYTQRGDRVTCNGCGATILGGASSPAASATARLLRDDPQAGDPDWPARRTS